MAKAPAAPIYRITRGTDGGWQAGQLVRVINASPEALAQFEAENFGRLQRFDGTIDRPEDVAELNLAGGMDFTPPADVDLGMAEMKRALGVTEDAQIELAINVLGMDPGRLAYTTDGLFGEVTKIDRKWRSNEQNWPIDLWLAALDRVFPNARPKR